MAGVGRWRVVLAGLLTLPLMLLGAPGASAQSVGSWYLPESWADVLVGSFESVRDLLTGSGVVSVEAGADPLTVGPDPSPGYLLVIRMTGASVTSDGAPAGQFFLDTTYTVIYGPADADYQVSVSGYRSNFVHECADGYEVATGGTRVASGPGWGRLSFQATGCNAHGGYVGIRHSGLYGQSNYLMTSYRLSLTADLATTTTELVCRSASGDQTISETSAPGATVAPMPACPAGSYPVRLTVTNSATGVVSDASISAPGWYMGDPQSWEFEKFQNGLRCVDGTPTCDAVWDEDTDSCMAYNHTTGEYREVVDAVCQGAAGDGFLSGGGAAETPTDPDQGIINRSLEAIRSAIDKAKTAIVGGLVAAARTVAGAVDAVRSAVDAVRSAVSSAADQAAADAAAARDKLDSILDGIAGLGQAVADLPGRIGEALTPSSGAMGAQIGRMGDAVTGKFAPWTAVAEDYAGAFAVSGSCSCLGPPLKLPAAMGGHTVYPASSCGHLAPFAAASKTFTAAVLLVGCAAAVLHFIMTAFGFVSPIGRAAARVGGPGAQAGRGTLDSSGTVSSGTVDWDLIADRDASIPKSQRDASPLWKS